MRRGRAFWAAAPASKALVEIVRAVIVAELFAGFDVAFGLDVDAPPDDVGLAVRHAGMVDVAREIPARRPVQRAARTDVEQIDRAAFLVFRLGEDVADILDDALALGDRLKREQAKAGAGALHRQLVRGGGNRFCRGMGRVAERQSNLSAIETATGEGCAERSLGGRCNAQAPASVNVDAGCERLDRDLAAAEFAAQAGEHAVHRRVFGQHRGAVAPRGAAGQTTDRLIQAPLRLPDAADPS